MGRPDRPLMHEPNAARRGAFQCYGASQIAADKGDAGPDFRASTYAHLCLPLQRPIRHRKML